MENNQVSQKSYSPSSGKYLIEKAHINSLDQYKEIYDRSIQDPEVFWSEIAERITWFKKWDQVCEYDFVNASVKWFEGATLNACYNCLDRHIEDGHGDDTALIWEGNNPSDPVNIAASSESISPNKLSARITSNCFGFLSNCIAQLSANM